MNRSRARILLAVVLLACGLWLTGMASLQAVGARAWRDDDLGVSRAAWRLLPPPNVVEPDIAHSSRGLTAYADRRFAAARTDFTRAYRSAPAARRCAALRNVVLALEAHAVSLAGANDEFVQEREYRRALRELDAAPRCSAEGARDGASARELRAARERIESRPRATAPVGSFVDQQETQYGAIRVERESIALREQRLQNLQREAQQSYAIGGLIGRNADAAPVEDGDPRW